MKFGTCLQNNCSFDVLIYELNSSHVVVIVALIFNFAYDTLIFSIFFSFFPAINLIILFDQDSIYFEGFFFISYNVLDQNKLHH